MFCSECGNKIMEGAKFCPECGTPVFVPTIEEAAEEAAEQVQETVEEVPEVTEAIAEDIPEPVQEEVPEEIPQSAAEPDIPAPAEETDAKATTTQDAPETAPETVPEPLEAEKIQESVKAEEIPAPVAKSLNTGSLQTAAMVLAAISVICLFISISRTTVVSRIFYIIAAGMLTFLGARKEKYPSVLHAIPVCIIAIVNIFSSARLIFISITNRYYRYRPQAISSLYKILLIAAFVLLLLLGIKAVTNRRPVNRIILVISALLAIYHLVFLFRVIRSGRVGIFFHLAMLLFFAAYIVICVLYEKNAGDEPEEAPYGATSTVKPYAGKGYTYTGTRQGASADAASSAPLFGPGPEPQPKQTPKTEAAPMFRTEENFAPDPDYVFCVRCGARLPAGSAFCNKCGAPVIK